MKTIISLLVAFALALATTLPSFGSEQALRELQAMSDMTDAELQAMADDLGKTLEELGVMAREDMGLGKPKTVTKTLDEIRAMSLGELEALAAEIGNAACTEVRQAVEWSYPHGVLATEQQFVDVEKLKGELASCESALSRDKKTVETFFMGNNFHLDCLTQALMIPREEAYRDEEIEDHRQRSSQIRESSSAARQCFEAYEQKFNRRVE